MYILREENKIIKHLHQQTSTDDLYMFSSGGLSGYKDIVNLGKFNVVGYVKVGVKTLFVMDELNRQIELSPLCVLDFYIDDELQRKGYGKRLFDYMLSLEFLSPKKLGYDRPSTKFMGFLKKHYGLSEYIKQNNNFVVFRDYGLRYLDLGFGVLI
jgi:GNAT superfamily N-acetyltransferase